MYVYIPTSVCTVQCAVYSVLYTYILKATKHTSYLSRAPRAVPVEKIWSCGEICPHDRWSRGVILHMKDCHVEKNLHMRNVKTICGRCGEIMCTMYGFCCRVSFCDLRCFVAKSVFVIHALLCGEKFGRK